MAAILTAAEMRDVERRAIESGAVTGLELMERAGRGVVEAILAEWLGIEEGAKRAVVLCGPGNNGGDGFVVARLLKERGWDVEAFLYGDAEKLPSDARANYERWRDLGNVEAWDDPAIEDLLDERDHDLVVDALFGIGLSRPMPADTARTWHGFMPTVFVDPPGKRRQRYVAVDIPSGLCSDSGRNMEGAFPVDLTVTFHRAKLGHYLMGTGELDGGPTWCGKLVVLDIGLTHDWRIENVELDRHSPYGEVKLHGHKYTHGHAVVLAGGCGKGGAARLAARGALRVGAGLVTLAVPPAALQENAARLDAIMLRSVKDAGTLTDTLSDPRLNALCAGPGLGTGKREGLLLAALLDASRVREQVPGTSRITPHRAVVLDADALTLLSSNETLRAKLHDHCVLTPHEGEFARLFPAIDAKWRAPATAGPAFSKVDAAREAAVSLGCVVLLKGPDTVIADPSGRAAVNSAAYDRAAPWLATAGSGDVLAGFITGLLARGLAPFDAACTAAWLHVEAARSFGPGLIAEDLPEELPKVFRALGL